jgi:hypothetical protein
MSLTPIGSLLDGKSRVVRDGKFIRVLDDDHCVQHGDTRICDLLAGLAAHYYKSWCFPTHEKICELLERFTGRKMSVRTLVRHLNALERDYYLHRTRRLKAVKGVGMVYRSTLYKMGSAFTRQSKRVLEAWTRWTLGEKMLRDLKGEIRSGIRLPFLAHHLKSSIKRL